MKVKEAIEELQGADPEAELLLSSDEEGNSYRPVNISTGETFINQDGELVCAVQEDIDAGEYEGWEEDMFAAVVVW